MISKPQMWSPGLNAEHNVGPGLSHAWPLWERAGTRVADVVGDAPGTFNSASGTGPQWEGDRLAFTAASDDSIDLGVVTMGDSFSIALLLVRGAAATEEMIGGNTQEITFDHDGNQLRAVRSGVAIVGNTTTSFISGLGSDYPMLVGLSNKATGGGNYDLLFYANGKVQTDTHSDAAWVRKLRHIGKQGDNVNSFGGRYIAVCIADWGFGKAEFDALYADFFAAFRTHDKIHLYEAGIPAVGGGRIMSSLAAGGGLAGEGGIAGRSGGLAA